MGTVLKCTDCGNRCELDFNNKHIYGTQKPNHCILAQGGIVNWKEA